MQMGIGSTYVTRSSVINALAPLLLAVLMGCGGGGSDSVSTPVTYSVTGTITGLTGSGLVLASGTSSLPISAAGPQTYATSLATGTSYNVTVTTQPTNPSQTCTVANGSGTVAAANITNVAVTCVTNTYTVGVTVSGLASASNVVLQNNAGLCRYR
jgi:hypothetical protein